jgi:hypothetical protein
MMYDTRFNVGSRMHLSIRRSVAGVSLLALIAAPGVATSQQPGRPAEDSIPRELVVALLNLQPGPGGGNDIRVGKAPDDVPPELLPPGLQVLGSVNQFETAIIVVIAPQPPDTAIGTLEARLVSLGWTNPPTPRMPQPRGFVAADFGVGSFDRPEVLCRGEEFVTLSGTYRRSGGSVIKISYNRGQRYSACKARQDAAMYRSPYDEAPVPTLRAPFGSMMKDGNGMSSSGSTVTTSTRLSTRLKPAEIVAHYDKQMRDQGWTAGTEGNVPFLAARTYVKNDDKARSWTAVLTSLTLPDATEQDVTLRLSRR